MFRPFNCGELSTSVSRRHRRGHGPFRGRAPHDDVRVGCLNVCNDVPVDVSRNNEVTTTAVPAGTSRVPRLAPVSRLSSLAGLLMDPEERPDHGSERMILGKQLQDLSLEL